MLAITNGLSQTMAMTDNSSFFDDHAPQSDEVAYVDALHGSIWPEFCEKVAEEEAACVVYEPDDLTIAEVLAERNQDLSELFGGEYIGQPCKVLGVGYPAGGSYDEAASVVIDTASATFHGVCIEFNGSRWQAMFEVFCHEHTEQLPSGPYYIPAVTGHMVELEIQPNEGDEYDDDEDEVANVVVQFAHDTVALQALARSEDFCLMTPDDQRSLLWNIAEQTFDSLPRELQGSEAVVCCTQYYTMYDDMPGVALADSFTDLSDIPSEEGRGVAGRITRLEYPELAEISTDTSLNSHELYLNGGGYCLVVRDVVRSVTYYILPQSVTGII